MGLTLESTNKGLIERLDNNYLGVHGKGYRFSDNTSYAFIEVYWKKVSNHYLIQTRERMNNLRLIKGIAYTGQPIYGPHVVEILEPETSENTVDQRCLEILKEKIKSEGLDKILANQETAL